MLDFTTLRPWRGGEELPSPNYGKRPAGVRGVSCVVLHATADRGNEKGSESWLTDPASGVSAHLLIRRDGSVVRLVEDARRAQHAGKSAWRGRRDVNDFSLGWEIANRNDGREPYTDEQYATAVALAVHYVDQGLDLADVVSHAEVATPPGRKSDPAGWDWVRFRLLARAALSKAPSEPAADPEPGEGPAPPAEPPEAAAAPSGPPAVVVTLALPDADGDGVPDGAQLPLQGPPTNLPPPRPAPPPKPGWKSSEAWLTAAVNLPGLLIFAGLGEASPWVRIAGVLAAGVTTLAYGQGRTAAKTAARSFFPSGTR